MDRKTRNRKKTKRRAPTRRPARRRPSMLAAIGSGIGGALGSALQRVLWPIGWGGFAAGILIGAGLGVAVALVPDWPLFDPPGQADKVIAAPNPESRDPSTGARVKIETPKVVENLASAAASETAAPPEALPPAQPQPQPRYEEASAQSAPAIVRAQQTPTSKPTPPAVVAKAAEEPTRIAAIGPVDFYPSGVAGDPAWLRNSVAFSVPRGRPVIAIVLDDVGVNKAQAEAAIKLPPEITLSFMTYADGVGEMAARARAKGHELMVHVPMEPLGGEVDPGPQALKVQLSDAEILARLRWGLDRLDGYVGINNHMGSRFTQDERGMRVVIEEMRRRNLLFLDSRTIAASVGDRLAAAMGVAHVTRDVFLDDDMSATAVARQLAAAERVALATGQAIAIGHPHPATIAAIRAWLPGAKARGFVVAPLSVVAKRQLGASG